MKDIITKNAIVSTIIIILLVTIGSLLLSKNSSTSPATIGSMTPQVTTTQSGTPSKVATQTTTGTKTNTTSGVNSLPMTYSAVTNNEAYIRQLTANQGTCSKLAEKQYETSYRGVLESSGFTTNYTPASGQCYMKVTGQTRPQYATTTIGHIYFRNVLKSTVLAECTNLKGNTFTDADWTCIDKMTANTIIKARYDDLVNSYLSK